MINRHIAAGLALALCVTVAACSKKEEAPAPKADAAKPAATATIVKIGVASPLTGPQAHIGNDIKNGVQLAVEDLNAQGVVIGGNKSRSSCWSRRMTKPTRPRPPRSPRSSQMRKSPGWSATSTRAHRSRHRRFIPTPASRRSRRRRPIQNTRSRASRRRSASSPMTTSRVRRSPRSRSRSSARRTLR